MSLEHDDNMIDGNLKEIGRIVPLPERPDERRRAAWKRCGGVETLTPRVTAGRSPSPPNKLRRVLTTGWAAAAAVVIGVFLLTPMRGGVVEAATIFRSLRDSVHKGFYANLERIESRDDDVRVEGRVLVTFVEPISLAALMDDSSEIDPSPEQAYAKLNVRLGPNNSDAPGLNLRVEFACSRAQTWAFVQIEGIPQSMLDEAPFLVMFEGMLQRGLLLDLSEVAREELFAELDAEADDSPTGQVVRVGVSTNEIDMTIGSGDESDPDADADELFEQRLRMLLAGTGGAAELQEFVEAFRANGGNAEVREIEDGVWELEVRDLGSDEEDVDLANAELRVRYREGAGVAWATVEHVGDADGAVRLGFIDAIDPALLSYQRFIDEGANLIDVSAIIRMIESFAGQSGEE